MTEHEFGVANVCIRYSLAGRTTTNEELEEMLEQGNPAVFTQGVRDSISEPLKRIWMPMVNHATC